MKKISITVVLITTFLIVFLGCKEASKQTQTTIPYSTKFTVPNDLPEINTPYPIVSLTIPTNTETTLQNKGYKLNMVERIELEKINLVLNSPTDGDLGFFRAIQIYAEADGLEKVLLAEKTIENSTKKLTEISLDCKKINLLGFFKQPEIMLTALVTTDQKVTHEYTIDVISVCMADIKVFGL